MNFNIIYNLIKVLLYSFLGFMLTGCMKDDQWVQDHLVKETLDIKAGGVFVINEGNFMYGNATLSFYDTLRRAVENDLFYRVNGLPLGDVAESMSLWKSAGYIVVNNSGKVYAIDAASGKYTGKITGLTSPRHLHFVNNEKAYISDLYAGKITIVNPASNTITGAIPCPSHPSTEEMVRVGNNLFVTCWSGDNTVLVIDTQNDRVVREIPTGDQPCGIVKDHFDKIWVLCQSTPGKTEKNSPLLVRIDTGTLSVDFSLSFPVDSNPVKLTIDGKGENLFYISGNNIFKMPVSDSTLPAKPLIAVPAKLLYALGTDPVNGDIYVSDALDYQQAGWITRYSPSGVQLDRFRAGIIPGRFCFK